jgi:predicted transcriptional regulator of viral defense system
MKYKDFKKQVLNWPVIFSRDVVSSGKSGQAVRNQLERWRKSGRVIRLKKGVFILADDDRKVELPRPYLANQLYGPSYVSLEYALSYYGLIPERVNDITSVTSRKTMRFTNEAGTFIYRHVKPKAYRGFDMAEGESALRFFIAEPEKAVVDFLYFNLDKFAYDDPGVFEESYRFQNTERLDMKKVRRFAGIFENKKLVKIASLFSKHFSVEKGRTA